MHLITVKQQVQYLQSMTLKVDSKNTSWPKLPKHQQHINNILSVFGKSKQSHNKGTKMQIKRAFQNYSFLSPKKKTDRLCIKFSSTPNTTCAACDSTPISKQLPPHSVVAPFLKKCPHTIIRSSNHPNDKQFQFLSQSFEVNLKDTSSHFPITFLGQLLSSKKVVDFL